jgi:hypothetical protein
VVNRIGENLPIINKNKASKKEEEKKLQDGRTQVLANEQTSKEDRPIGEHENKSSTLPLVEWEQIKHPPLPSPPPLPKFANEGGGSWLYLHFCLLSGTGSDSLVKSLAHGKKKLPNGLLSQMHEERLLGTQ